MKPLFFTTALSVSLIFSGFAQPVRLKLPRQINTPGYNHYAPSLTADGLTMIYATNYYVTEGNTVDLKITYSKGVDAWGSGEDIAVVNKSGPLNLYGGHCISPDGRKIYFTSRKTGGVGGFDIWVTERRGTGWSAPQNLGKPVNSEGSDGFPSISADGKFLYFIRCGVMANTGCKDCRLYVSEGKGQEIWKPASEIKIKGNVLYPRISKDGSVLFFSSDKAGGKGGYDLYQIRKSGDGWSEPRNMEFINTSRDEIYADVTSQADALIYAAETDNFLTLYRAKLPDTFQPDRVIIFSGKISPKLPAGTPAFLQISDNNSGAPVSIRKVESDGTFSAVLQEGKSYDVALTGGNDRFYWSGTYDATKLEKTRKEVEEVEIPLIEKGKLYYGSKALFDSTSYKVLPGTAIEGKRLAKILQAHGDWKAEIILFPAGVSNNPPDNGQEAYEKMRTSLLPELTKAGISAEKINFVNGFQTPEEDESFSGWGIRFLW